VWCRTSHSPWAGCSRLAMPVILTAFCAMPAIGQVDQEMHVDIRAARMIEGQVRTTDNKPLPLDITVRLEEAVGQPSDQQFVGSNGKFEFRDLTGSTYRLTVTAKGFQTVTQDIDMTYGVTQRPMVYLVPIITKTPPPPADTATDLAAPRQARREFEKGARELDGGNLAEARMHLEKAVAADPCYARAQTALGVTLSRQQHWVEAESAFRNSIKCDGGFLDAYLQLAVLLKGRKKYQECAVTLEQGLRQFPNEWRLHYRFANAKEGLGEYETAEQEYLKTQALNAQLPSAFHLQLADFYRNWKKYDKAQAEMETYLRADPNGQFAEATRKMLRELQASGLVPGVPSKTDQGKP
jgi:tetratricopeptide (TPR) repeat protein